MKSMKARNDAEVSPFMVFMLFMVKCLGARWCWLRGWNAKPETVVG